MIVQVIKSWYVGQWPFSEQALPFSWQWNYKLIHDNSTMLIKCSKDCMLVRYRIFFMPYLTVKCEGVCCQATKVCRRVRESATLNLPESEDDRNPVTPTSTRTSWLYFCLHLELQCSQTCVFLSTSHGNTFLFIVLVFCCCFNCQRGNSFGLYT